MRKNKNNLEGLIEAKEKGIKMVEESILKIKKELKEVTDSMEREAKINKDAVIKSQQPATPSSISDHSSTGPQQHSQTTNLGSSGGDR